jgi:tRNA modification GTPase
MDSDTIGQADTFSAAVPTDTHVDTIAAIATACGRGGIGIVRISGPSAQMIAGALFHSAASNGREAAGPPAGLLSPYRLNYGHIIDPGDKCVIDEVLLAFMPAPRSYTREDVVEIQSHGGAAVLNHVLTLVLQYGARLAEPGEFTRRAFLNGRIDLSQAEAVADLISATSERSLYLAADQLKGGLRRRIDRLLDAINDIFAELEACIEFPEDFDGMPNRARLRNVLAAEVISPIELMIHGYTAGRMMRDGIHVVIAGRPNVGKSSLFNQLIQSEKAIVTPIPGTTRDPVESCTVFRGVSINYSDTAGIHLSGDPIEAIGIHKSKEAIADADIVLILIDASEPECAEDLDVYTSIQNRPAALVVNKIDLVESAKDIVLPDRYRSLPVHYVSALDGSGIDALTEGIYSTVMGDPCLCSKEALIVDIRHKICLEEALICLQRSLSGLENGISDDLICIDLQCARMALKRIIGEEVDQDLLNRIFGRFCIGK